MMFNSKTIRLKRICAAVLALVLCAALLTGCSSAPEKTKIRLLIVTNFEIGEISGDFPGEHEQRHRNRYSGQDPREERINGGTCASPSSS